MLQYLSDEPLITVTFTLKIPDLRLSLAACIFASSNGLVFPSGIWPNSQLGIHVWSHLSGVRNDQDVSQNNLRMCNFCW